MNEPCWSHRFVYKNSPSHTLPFPPSHPPPSTGGSKSLFIVTQEGKVYACGEGTGGRLGLGHCNNVATPKLVSSLNQFVVKKVAVHSGGRHAMALTVDGKVFSWGEGDDGKLGKRKGGGGPSEECFNLANGFLEGKTHVGHKIWSCFPSQQETGKSIIALEPFHRSERRLWFQATGIVQPATSRV